MDDYDFRIRDSIKSVAALVLLLLLLMVLLTISTTTSAGIDEVLEFVPVKNYSREFRVVDVVRAHGETQRRRLEPYQLCLVCKCCAGTTCSTMPCCFGIDCQLPGKPFGLCAFVPKTCNCANCTSSSRSSSSSNP